MNILVVDFDGTIAQAPRGADRPHTPTTATHSWVVMDPGKVARDRPRRAVVRIMRNTRLHTSDFIMILTGRPESARGLTEAWLLMHGVPYDQLTMVGTSEMLPTVQKKRPALERIRAGGQWDSVTVVDDDPAVLEVAKDLGFMAVDAREVK